MAKKKNFYKGDPSRISDRPNIRPFLLIILVAMLSQYSQIAKSEKIYLKCLGKFEIDRGKLIKPDWEITYLRINKNGLMSTIDNGGVRTEGRTSKRGDSYIITHRDKSYRVKAKYIFNEMYGTYSVNYPEKNKILIGTCQKGRG